MKSFKFVMALFVAVMFSSVAFAGWSVPGSNFGLGKIALSKIIAPPQGGETDLILIPTAALGLGVDNGQTASYGLDLAYDLLICRVNQGEGSNVNLTSYIGVGAAIFFDAGPALSSTFQQALVARIGVNIIGPEINGIVPGVMETFDLNTGDRKVLVNMNAPFDLFSGAITKVAGL